MHCLADVCIVAKEKDHGGSFLSMCMIVVGLPYKLGDCPGVNDDIPVDGGDTDTIRTRNHNDCLMHMMLTAY